MFQVDMSAMADSRAYIRQLQTKYYLLVFPSLAFFLFAFLASETRDALLMGPFSDEVYLGLAGGNVAILGLIYLWFQKQTKSIRPVRNMVKALEDYAPVSMKMAVALGFLSSMSALLYLLTSHQVFIALFILTWVMTSISLPESRRISRHLRLKKEYRVLLMAGDAFPAEEAHS